MLQREVHEQKMANLAKEKKRLILKKESESRQELSVLRSERVHNPQRAVSSNISSVRGCIMTPSTTSQHDHCL